jgi:hypothetical protein
MGRSNPSTFLTLFNNSVITLNQLVQKLLRRETQTNGQAGDITNISFHFEEISRLKIGNIAKTCTILHRVGRYLSRHNLKISHNLHI